MVFMKPKVVVRRGLKHAGVPVWGTAQYAKKPIIELDKSLKGFNHLTILVHEALHLAYPDLSEADVRRGAKLIAAVEWSQGYRRVER